MMNLPALTEIRKLSNAITSVRIIGTPGVTHASQQLFQIKFSLILISIFNIGLASFYLEMLIHQMGNAQPEVKVGNPGPARGRQGANQNP